MHTLARLLILAATLQTSPGVTRQAFERAAAEVDRFVDAGCVLYDRDESRSCESQAGGSLKGPYAVADLEALTRHANPRVRTLALVHLFAKGDPKLLPIIFALVTDPADTFPEHIAFASVGLTAPKDAPKRPQTVGAVAEHMIRFYLERGGYSYGLAGISDCPGFDDYWRQRQDRTVLASWFTVQLDRATQGTSPIQPNRERQFAAIRSRVEQLRGDDRLWYSLFVGAAEGGDRVFTEVETLSFAQAIGPERLMQMIVGRAPESDPDLAPIGRPASCGARDVGGEMRRFVLQRAALLLRPADAEVLLQSPEARHALWAIAAAALRPDRAEAILTPAIEKLDRKVFGWDQAQMAAALPRIAGETHVPYALDWFYGSKPGEPVTNAQEIFINEVVARGGRPGRALLAALIDDRRFDTLSGFALARLIAVIGSWLPSPLVANPYQSLSPDQEARVRGEWRQLARQSVPNWK
jgi:hypothetical protein